jgi:4-amino-4-deoxy-L-arabinose transferase-like glycosyltransferase
VPTQDFFGRSIVNRIIVYPLHNNLLQVWMSLWIGTFDDVLIKIFNPFYLLSMAICLYYISLRETNRFTAFILIVIILSAPLLSYHSIEVNSDLMLGVYLFLASASFLKGMRGEKPYWFLTGIFSVEALFTKQEAFFFVLPLLLSALVYLKSNIKGSSKKFVQLLPLLIPFLAIIPWYAFTVYYGLGWGKMAEWIIKHTSLAFDNDPNRITEHLTFHPEVITGYIYWLVSLDNFNVIIFFFPLLLILHIKISKQSLHLLFPIVFYMLFFLVIYIFTEYYSWFLLGTIFYRNILTCYPVICLLTVLLLGKDNSLGPDTEKIPI